jgi:hypothetical protein
MLSKFLLFLLHLNKIKQSFLIIITTKNDFTLKSLKKHYFYLYPKLPISFNLIKILNLPLNAPNFSFLPISPNLYSLSKNYSKHLLYKNLNFTFNFLFPIFFLPSKYNFFPQILFFQKSNLYLHIPIQIKFHSPFSISN